MKKALFVGRFQPFHNGHLKAIKELLKKNEWVTIVISGPKKPDAKNPFSFEEREMMMHLALSGECIKNYDVRKIADVNNDRKWAQLIKALGDFSSAYTRNSWTARCLKIAGITVQKHNLYERYKNCGSEIRKRIMHGKRWKNLVPYSVYDYISEIEGEKRIRGL